MMMSLRKSASETSVPRPDREVPHLVGPLLECDVVRDAALERDGVVFGAAWRFAGAARIAAFAMLHHFGGALQHADLADSGDIFSVPLTRNLKFLYGSKRFGFTTNSAIVPLSFKL